MTDLKSCPFCKGVNIELIADEICCPVEYFGQARCSDCEAVGPLAKFKYDTEDEAKAGGAEAWNTRAEPTVKQLVWHRIDDPDNPPPMDGTAILVFARWDWEGLNGLDCDETYQWAVAEYSDDHRESGFWARTQNPYSDMAVDPKYWCPLPPDDV